MMVGSIAILYRFAPSGGSLKWNWISWGAVIATGALDRGFSGLFVLRFEIRIL